MRPPTIPQQVETAQALRSAGLYAEALEALSSPAEFNADLCAMRGAIEFALGRFEAAALSYSAVAISQPDNPDALHNLALCLQRSGRWDAAAEAYQRLLRLDAEQTGAREARLGLGACLLELKRAEEALEVFDQACTGARPEPALFGKAVALQLLDQFDEAAGIYQELLDRDPDWQEVLSNWIAMSIQTDDLEQVRRHSLRLLDIDPQSVAALRGLATVALEDGDHQAAATYCGRLLDLAPNGLEAWHNFRIAIEHTRFGAPEPVFAVHYGGKR